MDKQIYKKYKEKFFTWFDHVKILYKSLSPEQVLLFFVLSFVSIVLFFSALVVFNSRFVTKVPTYGGNITEGIIGTPRFINPVLATSDQDRDLTSLVYAGLTKKDSLGHVVLDMAEEIIETDDNLGYHVTLKDKAYFHNGEKVTSDDVIYTVSLIQNPNIKSPHFVEWEGITIEKISSGEFIFHLKKPFPLFMNVLTMGILPKSVWKNLSEEQFSLSDYNIKAIGSGPYKITNIKTDSGIPTGFVLEAHEDYTLGRPYVKSITINTYQNEKYLFQAFSGGNIDRIMYNLPNEKIAALEIKKENIKNSLLPRTITVFFNPSKVTFLSDKQIRLALATAINKQEIVDQVLQKYGKIINTPFPFDGEAEEQIYDVEKAKELLQNSKTLKKSSVGLEITLTTGNTDEMKSVAEIIKKNWEEIGVKTTLAIYEIPDLNQSVIKERDFQVLLFGSIVQNPSDLYAFWHSSQRSFPGLNISNYVSKKLDTNLETLRESEDELDRISAYEEVIKEFKNEIPGIFLYASKLIYVTNDKVVTFLPEYSFDSSSRFSLIHSWYRYEESVWPKTYYKKILEKLQNSLH